ncbi:MAG TPA: PEP-CTERM sorting domain-containing protein, partial [Roseiarcus sp.]|nr:PEP-CTERM sorting domain-containing protein [Roseiarcus sp.]
MKALMRYEGTCARSLAGDAGPVELTAGGPGVSEGAFAQFSDPFSLSANSVLGAVTLESVPSIPEPATLVLLAPGFFGLLAASRRRARG